MMKVGKGKRRIYFKKARIYSSSAFWSTNSRDNAGRTELRSAAVFEGSRLKRLLVEVCDLAFDDSFCRECSLAARIHTAKSEDALM